jgi:hypothetical protein
MSVIPADSDSGVRDQEDLGSNSAVANSQKTLSWKNPITKKNKKGLEEWIGW